VNEDAARGVTHPALRALLSEQWEAAMAAGPTGASRLGDHRYDDRLDDISGDSLARQRADRDRFLARAEAIPVRALDEADRTTLELFAGDLRLSRGMDACHNEEWGLSARSNPLIMANELGDLQPIVTAEDASNYLSRVGGLAKYVADDAENLRRGLAAGRTPDAASVRLVIDQVDAALARAPEDWHTFAPALAEHPEWDAAARTRFHDALRLQMTEAILPAFQRYRTFLATELLPHARGDDHAGVWALPDGGACYAALIAYHTSLPLTADALHRTGLAELDRIHGEMRVLGKKLFGTEDLPTLFARLRDDPALRFSTAAEVEAKANNALAAARARIPQFFGRLPAADCFVRPVPDYEAPYTTIAYYRPLVPGEQPGYYYVNTYQPETRPRFEAEVLAFHESIPGHHLQIAIAQELPELPAFRKNMLTTVFVEGWALYTERLADEMGLYSGDLDRLGMLSFDSWRASRLVVDTGIHAQHWTRKQAEQFMLENTPLAANNIANEVDRYITWPGQALAYKTGQLEILRLRKEAEAKLGDRFSLPAFHDAILGGGAVTLPVLDRRMEAWMGGR
jgi:uncharacterized protein (DUF885 family)